VKCKYLTGDLMNSITTIEGDNTKVFCSGNKLLTGDGIEIITLYKIRSISVCPYVCLDL
jgi:hypothetical protein